MAVITDDDDPALLIRQVRLLIADTNLTTPIFTDDDILTFLSLEGRVKRAAAAALDTIASSEALVSKAIRTQDLATDGPKVATALHAHAEMLRAQDIREENEQDAEFTVLDFDPPIPLEVRAAYAGTQWLMPPSWMQP